MLQPDVKSCADNLTPEERTALHELANNEEIIIKKADKGGNFIIMDKSYYRDYLVLENHLNDNAYKKIDQNEDRQVIKKLNTLLLNYEERLTRKEVDFISNFEWKTSNFYVFPKIHKCKEMIQKINEENKTYVELDPPEELKSRPIIAGPLAPTQRLSEFLDTVLKPLVPTLKTYIKDDWDFLRKLPRKFEQEVELYSCDITSLYTSIPHELGLEALNYWINKKHDLIPERLNCDFIIDAAKFILENNNFLFDGTLYKQTAGTAMGTKFAPSYACLTIGYLEETKLFPLILPKYFNRNECALIEDKFYRYMDDGFIALPKQLNIDLFLNALNELHPDIKFTLEKSKQKSEENIKSLNFLDIEVIIKNNKYIETDIFYKDTNPHDYLDFKSAHPVHIKHNIPYNLAKRVIVFVSDSERVDFRLKELEKWLLDCHYPLNVIRKAFHNAKLQGPAPCPSKDIIPLVTTYYPQFRFNNVLQNVSNLLKNVNDKKLKTVFAKSKPVIALKQPKNLLSTLTKAKFETHHIRPQPRNPGISLCSNKRCKLCKQYLQPVTSFTTANYSTWEIKSSITCQSKNVVYFLSCNMCNNEMSYIGQTKNLRNRMNNHISESRTGISTCSFPKHVHECGKRHNKLKEPFFKIFVFFALNDPSALLYHEEKLFKEGHALLNS